MCSLAEFVSKNEISHASSKSISWDAISRFSWHVISVPSLLQILKHYSKPGVEAKEVLPLFPDFKVIISCFPFSQNLPSPIPLSFLLPLLSLPSLPPPPPSLSPSTALAFAIRSSHFWHRSSCLWEEGRPTDTGDVTGYDQVIVVYLLDRHYLVFSTHCLFVKLWCSEHDCDNKHWIEITVLEFVYLILSVHVQLSVYLSLCLCYKSCFISAFIVNNTTSDV